LGEAGLLASLLFALLSPMSRAFVRAFLSASVFSASVIAVFPLSGVAAKDPGSREAVAASLALLVCTAVQAASVISLAEASQEI